MNSSKEIIFAAFHAKYGYVVNNGGAVLGYSDSISDAGRFYDFDSADKFVKSGEATEVRSFEIVYKRIGMSTQKAKRQHFAKIMNPHA